MPSTSFGRSKRLHGKTGFDRVFRRGRVIRQGDWALYSLPNGLKSCRFGCAVRRAAVPKAVFRNRLKRWLREAFRRNPGCVPAGLDVVVRVHRWSGETTYSEWEKTFRSLCKHLKPPTD